MLDGYVNIHSNVFCVQGITKLANVSFQKYNTTLPKRTEAKKHSDTHEA